MVEIEKRLNDPAFWTYFFYDSSGHIAKPPNWEDHGSVFSATIQQAEDCFALLEDTKPSIPVAERFNTEIAIRFGDGYTYELADAGVCLPLGRISSHWLLPGIRWSELEFISRFPHPKLHGLSNPKAVTKALLLPITWVTTEAEARFANMEIPDIMIGCGAIASPDCAQRFASKWIESVSTQGEYPWYPHEGVWASSSDWSLRNPEAEGFNALQAMLKVFWRAAH